MNTTTSTADLAADPTAKYDRTAHPRKRRMAREPKTDMQQSEGKPSSGPSQTNAPDPATIPDSKDPRGLSKIASVIALLMNATYFKGKWREQFDAASTRSAPFRVTLTRTDQLLTMFNEKGLVRAGGTPDGTLIGELPYGGDAFVMDVIVPPLGTIEAAADALTPSRFRSLLALLPDSSSAMLLALPKFRLETGRELKPALGALGIHRAFGDAQLAPMFAGPRSEAQVSSVLQKVFVDVNEEGTEAVAVTLVTVVERTSASPPQFVVDRPFLFVIRERLTGTILFLGKVVRPTAP